VKAIILAGGKGTRLAPYTTVLPKPLMPLGDKPILDIIVRQLKHHGFTDITMAVGHLAELIMAYFGDGDRHGVHISYSREEQPLGTAGPLGLIRLPNEPFLVMNGDVLTTLDFRTMHDQHVAAGAFATVGVCPRSVQVNLGTVSVDAHGRVLDYIEKPQYDYLASIGIYVFSPVIAQYVRPHEHLDLPALVKMLIADGREVRCYNHVDYWLDIGRPDDYEAAQADFERMRTRLLRGDAESA